MLRAYVSTTCSSSRLCLPLALTRKSGRRSAPLRRVTVTSLLRVHVGHQDTQAGQRSPGIPDRRGQCARPGVGKGGALETLTWLYTHETSRIIEYFIGAATPLPPPRTETPMWTMFRRCRQSPSCWFERAEADCSTVPYAFLFGRR